MTNQRSTSQTAPKLPTIEDPFEHWVTRAVGAAQHLNLPLEFIEEAAAIIRSAFGEEWIRQSLVRPTYTPIISLHRHPVLDGLATAGPNQCVELLELAVYLKRLVGVRNLEQVVKAMKKQYAAGFLQLAYAYRFLKVGATGIILEPPAEGGRLADIACDLLGRKYLIECYIPRSARSGRSIDEFQFAAKPIMKALGGVRKILRLSIRLRTPIDSRGRREIQQLALNAIQEFQGSSSLRRESNLAEVLIEDISDQTTDEDFPQEGGAFRLYGDADWGMNAGQANLQELVRAIRSGEGYSKSSRGSRMFVWGPPEESKELSSEERIDELVRKINEKLAQTRDPNAQAYRIVIVKAPREAQGKDNESTRICSQIQQRIIPNHDRVAAIFVTDRVWTPERRFRYVGKVLLGREHERLPGCVWLALNIEERFKDILSDWG